MLEKKEYLVDVPVLLFVFIRPQTLRRVFGAIKEARPSKLYLASDGPRENVPSDRDRIKECRQIVDDIDWDCEVHKIYFEKNQGMYATGRKACDYVFEREDRLIFLEDDILPCRSFFKYCAEVLEIYKNDLRVHAICGMNTIGIYDAPKTDYFFSHTGSIWGFAIWKRTYESYYHFEYGQDPYVSERVKQIARKDTYFCKVFDGYAENEVFDGHPAGPEFFLSLSMYAQNQLFVVPRKNMIKCIGYSTGSTHAVDDLKKMSKGARQIFDMETYDIEFPMKMPCYIFPDEVYEKKMKRVIAWHHPVISFYRRCVGVVKRIYYGDGRIILKKIPEKLFGKKRMES